MGVRNVLRQRALPVMWTGSLAPRVKIRIILIPNRLTLRNFFTVHTYFTKVAAGRIIQPGRFGLET